MKIDGVAIDPEDVTLEISSGNDCVTVHEETNTIVYDKNPIQTLAVDVTATYDGHTASTYIVLDDFQPTKVLVPNDPA
jgi:hypothetical protein